MPRTRMLALVPAAALLALSACGESRSGTKTSASASGGTPVKTVTVKETEFSLSPSTLKVDKTGVVQITARNSGTITHALEVEGPGGESKTQDIAPGKSATLKVDLSKAGTYEWYCPIDGHKGMGMKGQIVVAGGGSGGSGSSSNDSQSGRSGY
jgi:plastocyanin